MFSFHNIQDYHRQLDEGATSCVQAVSHYLEKIRSAARLNAFIEVYEQESLERATFLDEKRKKGDAYNPEAFADRALYDKTMEERTEDYKKLVTP